MRALEWQTYHHRTVLWGVSISKAPKISEMSLIVVDSQPFWGNMVAVAGAGPKPIHHKSLNAQNLAEAIAFCLTPEAAAAAGKIAVQMSSETGVRTAVDSFHSHLPVEKMACDVSEML
jgi:hypothetical protein